MRRESTPGPMTLLLLAAILVGCSGGPEAVVELADPEPLPSAVPITDGLTVHRPSVPGVHGLITAGHPLASMAGLRILLQGGTAADAAVAVLATLNLVEPMMSGAD